MAARPTNGWKRRAVPAILGGLGALLFAVSAPRASGRAVNGPDWDRDPSGWLRQSLSAVRKEARGERPEFPSGPMRLANAAPVAAASVTPRDYVSYRYTPYRPEPRPEPARQYQDYSDGAQRSRCERYPEAPECDGTRAYCEHAPWQTSCAGTKAACDYDPSSCPSYCRENPTHSVCAGTLSRCTDYPTAADCAGTAVRCQSYPSAADCAGTQERCTEYPSATDCAGTQARCEQYPSAADCVGTPAYCQQYRCEP